MDLLILVVEMNAAVPNEVLVQLIILFAELLLCGTLLEQILDMSFTFLNILILLRRHTQPGFDSPHIRTKQLLLAWDWTDRLRSSKGARVSCGTLLEQILGIYVLFLVQHA